MMWISSHLHLEVRGEGVVTAADIQCPSEVEIVNPDLYLFTVDDKKTRLEIDLTVERAVVIPLPMNAADNLPIGELPVDAIFSPVKRVNWTVQLCPCGQSTNYDRLILEIWTDGTIEPEDCPEHCLQDPDRSSALSSPVSVKRSCYWAIEKEVLAAA